LAVSLLGGPEWVEDPSRSSRIGAVNVVSTIVTTGRSSRATAISTPSVVSMRDLDKSLDASAAIVAADNLIRCGLVSTHRQARGFRREHAPRTVIVPEEKNCNEAFPSKCLDADTALLPDMCAPEPGYANWRRRGWREPFFDQQTQGLLFDVHLWLLQHRFR
jgi:hypothetical protein